MTPDQKQNLDTLLAEFAAALVGGSEGTQASTQSAIHAYVDGVLPEYDLLYPVLSSSGDLVHRFDGRLTERGTFKKFNEEVDELKKAIYLLMADSAASGRRHPELVAHVAQELIDVLVTVGGMVEYAGLTWGDIRPAVDVVLDKNVAKSQSTHRWDETSESVVRREVQE